MNMLLVGAISLACLVAALFFLRYYRDTKDRFFLFFSIAFAVEGANRVFLGMSGGLHEEAPLVYGVRLLTFGLILLAIVDKNRAER